MFNMTPSYILLSDASWSRQTLTYKRRSKIDLKKTMKRALFALINVALLRQVRASS
jgi:hypothetical protein